MSISSVTPNPPPNTSQVSQAGSARSDAAGALAVEKMQVNVSIVQASYEVSIGTQNEPMQMLFKAAINGLNEALKPMLGDNAIQNTMNQDNSPEGTASRIAGLATGFFGAFQSLHQDQDQATAATNFLNVIQQGIDQGFKEARGILDGLGILQGDVAGNIDKTYALIQQKLDEFRASMGKARNSGGSSTASATPPSETTPPPT
ncbi:MAG: DUF5610 domain-containing protein [Sulfuricella sp.]|nr:DUF5610 domain-containing protein [Sulfuricella sp.]